MLPVPRPNLEGIRPYKPGRPIEQVVRELGIKGPVVKLASNENPLGPSQRALSALRRDMSDLHYYPEDSGYVLRTKLSTMFKVDLDSIIIGNGSVEIIMMACLAYLEPGDELVMSDHSFLMARNGAAIMNARLVEVPTLEYTHDLEQVLSSITPRTKIVYLDNPINPLGTIVTKDALNDFMARVPDHVLVIIDEAYAEYITARDYPKALDYYNQNKNVLILRTFSKVYGLAGLRIGYGFARPEIIGCLAKVRLPFNASRGAQVAAVAALDDKRHVVRSRKTNEAGKEFLYRELKKLNKVFYLKSYANFVFINFAVDSQEIFEQLQHRGVIARTVKEYNFPNALRVSVGSLAENKRFIKALSEVVS
ncbi:histidinol-phosphate transaminase [candidate division WOR-3 bacterium]|nr:histidinol-phosphate transaminase [candidate division WOR-3 bacterium]